MLTTRTSTPTSARPNGPRQRGLDVRTPFHRSEALAQGLSDADLRGSRFQTIFRGVFVCSSLQVTARHRAIAALKVVRSPGAYLSHTSAARMHGIPIPTLPDEHVSVPIAAHRRRTQGVVCHVADGETTTARGMPVSTCERVFVELATLLPLVDLVVAGDWLVRTGKCTLSALVAHVEAVRGHGAAAAKRAVAYVRDGVDSPMETRLRMLLVLAGLPEPLVNQEVRTADGTPIRRYDLNYPEARVIVEYDGRHHVEVQENWEKDLLRREDIDNDQWRIVIVTAAGIYRDPALTVRRVFQVLKRMGMPGLPARPSDEWRAHFERA